MIKFDKEVMEMAENDAELLNTVYREICENMGIDIARGIYRMFKGQQISFPVRFLNPEKIQKVILQEYDGTNAKSLAAKYNYSEKTVRRILKDGLEE